MVCLYRSGYYTIRTHRRNPTTARREHFELLDVSPGPNRTSSDNLATPGSPRVSMLTPSLVRTLVQRDTQCSRTPVLKPSSKSDLPCAWITAPATDASQEKRPKLGNLNTFQYVELIYVCLKEIIVIGHSIDTWPRLDIKTASTFGQYLVIP